MIIIIITLIGDHYGTMSEDEINGIIKAFILNFGIVYMNASWIDAKEKIEKEKEKDASADSL